jgi:hypothetical protein
MHTVFEKDQDGHGVFIGLLTQRRLMRIKSRLLFMRLSDPSVGYGKFIYDKLVYDMFRYSQDTDYYDESDLRRRIFVPDFKSVLYNLFKIFTKKDQFQEIWAKFEKCMDYRPAKIELELAGDGLWDFVKDNQEDFEAAMTTDIASTLNLSVKATTDVVAPADENQQEVDDADVHCRRLPPLPPPALLSSARLLSDQNVEITFTILPGSSNTVNVAAQSGRVLKLPLRRAS